jgi:hypothetical protein
MHPGKPVVNAHFFGERKEIVNGRVVNDTTFHYDIEDKQLKTLLLRPTSKINLLDRLRYAYGPKKHTHKKHTHKKHTHKKHTHKKGKRKGNRSNKKKHRP